MSIIESGGQTDERRHADSDRPVWPFVSAAAGVLSVPAMWVPLLHLVLVVLAGLAAVLASRDGRVRSGTPRVLCRVGLIAAVLSLGISLASCLTSRF